ncbi:CSS-motif domain-containing protein [Pseudomonas sp. dw_358]|uniref:CSS-motif domain-containing protein n=1 Tax=Pseudomonas sp. dw_358 TaxID=2720083 RepID=UPI001BD5A370|nr:CSS-motif domain-containing protein [Pseudomonas sp. dw_358]
MIDTRLTLTLPRWLIALALGLISAAAPVCAGYALHRSVLERSLINRIDEAVQRAIDDIDEILDQVTAVLPTVSPFATQDCNAPVIVALQQVATLHAYLRSVFIARGDRHVCGSFFGRSTHMLQLELPRSGRLLLQTTDRLTPTASSLLYSVGHVPYSVNLTVHAEPLAKPLRRSGEEVHVLMGVGDTLLDESGRVLDNDPSEGLPLRRVRLSERHDYRIVGGVSADEIQNQHARGLTSIIGSLLMVGIVVGGIVFTWIYRGRRG